MGKKHTLPESLELLLDTMCNTFGGIMFIAISLIVISQLVAKAQQDMTPEEINAANLRRMERAIETLQQELLALQKQELEAGAPVETASPEKQEAIRELLAVRAKALPLRNELERLAIKREAERVLLKRLTSEAEKSEREVVAKKRTQRETQRKIAEQRQNLESRIAQLEAALENLQPKELRFSREESTNLSPYWVLLKENKLYILGQKEESDEVAVHHFGNYARMIPRAGKGTMLGSSPEEELDFLFRGADRNNCFIYMVADHHSFAALLATRQYLRNKGLRVYWSVNPEYQFTVSSHVEYHASE